MCMLSWCLRNDRQYVIIPTQITYTYIEQFDLSRAKSKWLLYFDKSTEQKSWNFSFVQISKMS